MKKIMKFISLIVWVFVPLLVACGTSTTQTTNDSTQNGSSPTNDTTETTKNLFKKHELYSVVKTKLKNDTYVKVTDILDGTNPIPKDDIHVVPTKVSKLPSLWTTNDIKRDLLTKESNAFEINVEIMDYTDALVYANTRTNFPNKNSTIQLTLSDGKSQFRIANYDKNNKLLTIDGTNNGNVYSVQIEYSWLKAKINVIDINQKAYSFIETFLFLEGIGEFIEQKDNSMADNNTNGTNSKNRLVSDSFQNWINETAKKLNNSNELLRKIYFYLINLDENQQPVSYTDNLQFLTRIVHIKNANLLENIDKLAELSVLSKIYQDLPSELSYKPELKRLDGSDSLLLIKNQEIVIEANNLNENNFKGIRWQHHGKLNAIDYYWRGEGAGASNLSFRLSWIYKDPFLNFENN